MSDLTVDLGVDLNDLTENQRRALEVMENSSFHCSASWVGSEVYGKSYRKPQAYSRPGYNLLVSLEKLGLVTRECTTDFGWRWRMT